MERFKAISEVLGTLAIVVTLIFLTIETRQNTEALRSTMRQAAIELEVNWLYEMQASPGVVNAFGAELPDELIDAYEPGVANRAQAFAVATIRIREGLWLQNQSGSLDDETWENRRAVLLDLIGQNEFVRFVWYEFPDFWEPGFFQEITGLLEGGG